MSDNLKNPKFNIIIINKYRQKIKLCYFCYINCERQHSHIQVVFYALQMQDRPTFGVLSNQGLCHLCSVATTTKNFAETKFREKKSKFLVYGKTPIIQFSYIEKCLS